MGHVTDPGEEQNETASCHHEVCCCGKCLFSGASKRPAIFPHPHIYQQLKFCVQLFLGGPFNMSRISDEVSIWTTRPFPCKCDHIHRHCGTLLSKLEYCEARTSEFYAVHEIKTQHFSWVACLSDADPHVMILLHSNHKSWIHDWGSHFCPRHHIQTDSGTYQYVLGVK